MPDVLIRRFRESDLSATAEVHSRAFPRQGLSEEWLACNARAFPRTQIFVAQEREEVRGYVLWTQKAGFRAEAVLELEQIAVSPEHQGRGIGEVLIRESLSAVVGHLAEREARLKSILVTTRADNRAQRLYRRVLEVEVAAVVEGLYSADEVILVARNPGSALA